MRADWMFSHMFSFHDVLKIHDLIDLRSSCRLFCNSLPPPQLWTTFPCFKHPTLQSLLDCLHKLYKSNSKNVPSLLLIDKGEYFARKKFVEIKFPISIRGFSCEKTILTFGLKIEGVKDAVVEICDVTIREAEISGLWLKAGMNLVVRRSIVEKCRSYGVWAQGAHSRLYVKADDLQVIGCGWSGVSVGGGGTVRLSGENTRIQGNGTSGNSLDFGLCVEDSSSNILLVAPLTKKTISINNGGGGNWGGFGIGMDFD